MGRTRVEDFVDRDKNTFKVNAITLDPGIAGSGFAVWKKGEKYPVLNFPIKLKDRKAYGDLLAELIDEHKAEVVLIEKPAFQSSEKGQMVLRKGDLVELVLFVGFMDAVVILSGKESILVEVPTWKGQLPKDVVNRRIARYWPDVKAKSHDWDAIGIGLWAVGAINAQ